MNGWFFARGRVGTAALTDVTAAGARTAALPLANALFATGQTVFISEADGSETEWLGKVTSVSAGALGFSRPLIRSKNSGAILWRPEATVTAPAGGAVPLRRVVQTGVSVELTRGGDWMAVQYAEMSAEMTLTLDALTPAAERELVAWLGEQTGWGLRPFTLAETDGTLTAVQLKTDATHPIRRERDAKGVLSLTLPLVVVEEGGYR